MDRGYLPQSADNSPAPEAMVLIDHRTEVFYVMNEIRQNVNIHPLVVVVQNVAVPVCLINVLNDWENALKVASLVASSACVVAVVASSKFRNILLQLK